MIRVKKKYMHDRSMARVKKKTKKKRDLHLLPPRTREFSMRIDGSFLQSGLMHGGQNTH